MEAVKLNLGFSGRIVLADVNVSLKRGSITALIGPTGSGKSTFLRTLNRMNDRVPGFSRTGEVLFDDESLWGQNVDLLMLRRRVGMLFQRPEPVPDVDQGQRRGRREGAPHRQGQAARRRVRTASDRGRAVGDGEGPPERLAVPALRRPTAALCLARALAVGPEVLLLDEPTSALDPVTTESIEALIKTLTPALSLIVVTHNLGQAMRISDQTMFFYQGALVEHGATDDLFNRPQHPDTERYVTGRMG